MKRALTQAFEDQTLCADQLYDFREDQWWVTELEQAVTYGTDDQKRAMAVLRHLIRLINRPNQFGIPLEQ